MPSTSYRIYKRELVHMHGPPSHSSPLRISRPSSPEVYQPVDIVEEAAGRVVAGYARLLQGPVPLRTARHVRRLLPDLRPDVPPVAVPLG